MIRPTPTSTLFPYTTLFRSNFNSLHVSEVDDLRRAKPGIGQIVAVRADDGETPDLVYMTLRVGGICPHARNVLQRILHPRQVDRKSTRLNSSHVRISYAVFC